jgi:hypothetical protein
LKYSIPGFQRNFRIVDSRPGSPAIASGSFRIVLGQKLLKITHIIAFLIDKTAADVGADPAWRRNDENAPRASAYLRTGGTGAGRNKAEPAGVRGSFYARGRGRVLAEKGGGSEVILLPPLTSARSFCAEKTPLPLAGQLIYTAPRAVRPKIRGNGGGSKVILPPPLARPLLC